MISLTQTSAQSLRTRCQSKLIFSTVFLSHCRALGTASRVVPGSWVALCWPALSPTHLWAACWPGCAHSRAQRDRGTPGAGHPMAEPQQQLPGSGPGWCGWQGSTGTGSQSQPDSAQLPIAALCAQAAPVRPGVTTHFCHACKMLLPQIAKTNLILI